tara:strand:+ start:5261 stop:6394 length:1134 start_codon:yes stop_codon:yes gene_type:complete
MWTYKISEEGKKRLEKVKYFTNQAGLFGVSSLFMKKVIDHHLTGSSKSPWGHQKPLDANDFSRCGMFIICNPKYEKMIAIMKIVSAEWYNIIENWDVLINMFFYEDGDYGKCNTLFKEIIKTPRPDIIFTWPRSKADYLKLQENPNYFFEKHYQKKLNKQSKDITNLSDKIDEMHLDDDDNQKWYVNTKMHRDDGRPKYLEKPTPTPTPNQYKNEYAKKSLVIQSDDLDDDTANIMANQIMDNLNVLKQMEIPKKVAKILIPKVISKFNKSVNITWTWDPTKSDGSNSEESEMMNGWQEIYLSGETEYDTPVDNTPGRLNIVIPLQKECENIDDHVEAIRIYSQFRKQELTEDDELTNALKIIEQQEKSVKKTAFAQ